MILRRGGFQDLCREMNRLNEEMGRAFGKRSTFFGGHGFPRANVWEDEHACFVEADLPGIEIDKLDVSVSDGNQLTIQGERPALEVENAAWHRQERVTGTFTRVISLPTLVDANQVQATYQNGVLRLTLPKADGAKPRKITVRSA